MAGQDRPGFHDLIVVHHKLPAGRQRIFICEGFGVNYLDLPAFIGLSYFRYAIDFGDHGLGFRGPGFKKFLYSG
jgi:hypothetical protein